MCVGLKLWQDGNLVRIEPIVLAHWGVSCRVPGTGTAGRGSRGVAVVTSQHLLCWLLLTVELLNCGTVQLLNCSTVELLKSCHYWLTDWRCLVDIYPRTRWQIIAEHCWTFGINEMSGQDSTTFDARPDVSDTLAQSGGKINSPACGRQWVKIILPQPVSVAGVRSHALLTQKYESLQDTTILIDSQIIKIIYLINK